MLTIIRDCTQSLQAEIADMPDGGASFGRFHVVLHKNLIEPALRCVIDAP
jgi:hypothetical protein